MKLTQILRDSNYKLTQFSEEQILKLENTIFLKKVRGKEVPFINCLVRRKAIQLKPEEAVRQLYLMVLNEQYGYSFNRMEIEYAVSFGREKKRADIVIFDKQDTRSIYIMVELKKPKLKDGKEQLKSYCNATGAPIGVWSNGDSISFYHRKDPNYFEDLSAIPSATEKLSDILTERWTIDDLVKKDKLVTEKKSLKDLILEMEDEVLANAGVDVFEELFKLIFTKLYDEMESGRNKTRHLRFRNYGDTETELKEKIQDVFDNARKKWEGVFTEDSKIMLTPSHLSVCVSSLQDVKLFNSSLDVVDEAFEYLIGKSSKGEKGQYFTPRYVIDMCVKMMNPQVHETVIDTASGSCGFPVHSIFHVWEQILKEKGIPKSHLFTTEEKPTECTDYVQNKVFAIDFDEKAVRVARTLNLIAGDGQTNVLHLNTLDYERWDEKYSDEDWLDTYGIGWKNFRKQLKNKKSKILTTEYEKDGKTYVKEKKVYECRDFEFDVLMANPPFAGDIKESRILAKYELGKKTNGKYQTKVGRDILFIERNLDFLKPGGRMAVVLPQGRFNNSSDKNIRDYIAEKCRILGVVGLHGNVFKPHTGTKTSVLFIQKWDDKLCPKVEDYPIFFATQQEPSKDNSGEKIFVKKKDFPKNSPPFKEEYPKGEVVHTETNPKGEVVHTETNPKGEVVHTGEVVQTGGEFDRTLNNLPHLKTFRKELRNNLTPAEATLWTLLKGKQLDGKKFRRQHSVANYILDFYCPSESIAIELDGEVHNTMGQAEYDKERDLFLNHCGIKVLRFENRVVFENPDGLLQMVKEAFGWKENYLAGKNHSTLSCTPPYKEGNTIEEPIDHYDATPENLDEYLLDSHGHLIVKHDLFNHDYQTQDGIAEAFIEFAKKENLSFVGKQ